MLEMKNLLQKRGLENLNLVFEARPNDSDNDSIASNSGDSDDDDIPSQGSSSSAPARRKPKKTVLSKSKKSSGKKKPTTHVPVSKARVAAMLIKVMDLEMHEALEWLKESLSDAIEDYEVGNNEGIPLVPVMDYAETAMENPEFQQMLKVLGVCQPFDAQEIYWRIPGHLTLDTLQNYCGMIQQALDKTLQIEEEPESAQGSAFLSQNGNSSDDEDIFGKLRQMTKANSPEIRDSDGEPNHGQSISGDADESSRALNEEETTMVQDIERDMEIDEDSNAKNTSPKMKKSRTIQESDGESSDNASKGSSSENENIKETTLVQGTTKNMRTDDDKNAKIVNLKKKKSRIIQESDEESGDETFRNISPVQENEINEEMARETSYSRKIFDSDSEEEEKGSEVKRGRPVSDSDSEKPAAKRGKILESDDDDN